MKIALLGDIAFYGKYSLTVNPGLSDYFHEVVELLKKFDMVVGNLETPFLPAGAKTYGNKLIYIGSDPKNVELLKLLRISVVNLANNHIFDYGPKAFEYTKKILEKNGVEYFGVDDKQLEVEYDNNLIAFSGYCCYSTNPLGMNRGVNELDYPVVEKNLRENAQRGFLPVMSFHCGLEHVNYPSPDHIRMARKLSTMAPYVFYGHHPHVLQGIESIDESLLAYSLGNFCFDDVYRGGDLLIKQEQNNKEAAILELTIENSRLTDYRMIPIFIGEDRLELGTNGITEKIAKYSKRLENFDETYVSFRNELLNAYADTHRKTRNMAWYVRHMNLKTALKILVARKNTNKYSEKLVKQL